MKQRDKYISCLMKNGVKLARNGQFDEETFINEFFPNKDFILKKIKEKVESDDEFSKDKEPRICMDSYIFNKIKNEFEDIYKDFVSLRCNTKPFGDKDAKNQSTESMTGCESSSGECLPENLKKFPKTSNGPEVLLSQELLPGEKTNIYVQNLSVDVVRKKSESKDTDMDDSIIEKFTITRHAKK